MSTPLNNNGKPRAERLQYQSLIFSFVVIKESYDFNVIHTHMQYQL